MGTKDTVLIAVDNLLENPPIYLFCIYVCMYV